MHIALRVTAKQCVCAADVNESIADRAAGETRVGSRHSGRMIATRVALVAALAGCASQSRLEPSPNGAEVMSLLGTPLFPPTLPLDEVTKADAAVAAAPDDPDRLLAAGTARVNVWHFRDAVALYSRGVSRWPSDARFLRFRGHRYITLRRFDLAAADLDRAAVLDSTNFDIVYHQGLSHFLLGHYARAAAAYEKCLGFASNDALRAREASGAYRSGYRSCMRIATDDDARVSMSDWTWRTLMRAGRAADADRLLGTIREGMTVSSNRAYYDNLLMYKGIRTAAQLMQEAGTDSVRFSTSGFAVANFLLVRGDSVRAWEMFDRVAHSPHWSGFGVVGAEAEVVRRRSKR